MEHANSKTKSTAERRFDDLMQHGDDFFKIELLRPAKKYYLQALGLNPGNKAASDQIAKCDSLLAFERKVVWILTVVAVVFVLAYIVIGK